MLPAHKKSCLEVTSGKVDHQGILITTYIFVSNMQKKGDSWF